MNKQRSVLGSKQDTRDLESDGSTTEVEDNAESGQNSRGDSDSSNTETDLAEIRPRTPSARIKQRGEKKSVKFDMGYERTPEPSNRQKCYYCLQYLTGPCRADCDQLKSDEFWRKFVRSRGKKTGDYSKHSVELAEKLLRLPPIEKKSRNVKKVSKRTTRTTRKVKEKKEATRNSSPSDETKKASDFASTSGLDEESDEGQVYGVGHPVRLGDSRPSFRYHQTEAWLQQRWGGADFKFPAPGSISQTVLYDDTNHPMTSMALVPHSEGDIAFAVQNDTSFYVLQSKDNYDVKKKITHTFEDRGALNTEICLSPVGGNVVLRYKYANESFDTGECFKMVLYNLRTRTLKGTIVLDQIEDKPSKMAFSADGQHFVFLYQLLATDSKQKKTRISHVPVDKFDENNMKLIRITTPNLDTRGIHDIAFYKNTPDVLIIVNPDKNTDSSNQETQSSSRIYLWKRNIDKDTHNRLTDGYPQLTSLEQPLSMANFKITLSLDIQEETFI